MKKLLVIVGPTATGKTDLALEVAKKFDGELISADSRQIYQGMDVGTGKIDLGSRSLKRSASGGAGLKIEDLEKHTGYWIVDGIKIHLYDLIKPNEGYSVAQFQQAAYKAIEEIHAKNKLPILVGGTGLYVQAIVEGLKIPKVAPDAKLREKLEKKSTETLLNELKEIDPVTYHKIDQSNRRRLIRALEVYYTSGQLISTLKAKFKVNFDIFAMGLITNREELYRRADKRIDQWYESEEFQKETQELLKNYSSNLPSFTSLGYQEVVSYLKKQFNREGAIQRTKFKHHGFIRRQLTWFRKMNSVAWFDIDSPEKKELFATIANWRS